MFLLNSNLLIIIYLTITGSSTSCSQVQIFQTFFFVTKIVAKYARVLAQGTLTEGGGSVQLTSLLR